jgi:hypothetical protein
MKILRNRSALRWLRAFTALVIALQMILFIPHMIWPKNFVPSEALQSVGLAWGIMSFLAMLSLVWPSTVAELRTAIFSRQYKKAGGSLSLLVLGPIVMGFCMGCGFISGPISYHLHRMSNSAILGTTTHRVQYADDFGPTSCGNRAVLAGDRFLWPQRVCHLQSIDMDTLRRGGLLSVFGTASKYGLLVVESHAEIDNLSGNDEGVERSIQTRKLPNNGEHIVPTNQE